MSRLGESEELAEEESDLEPGRSRGGQSVEAVVTGTQGGKRGDGDEGREGDADAGRGS